MRSSGLPRRCRSCGCTEEDCTRCALRTGGPCSWVEDDLCSACREPASLLVHVPGDDSELACVVLDAGGPALDAVASHGQYVSDLGALGDHLLDVLDMPCHDHLDEGVFLLRGRLLATPADPQLGQVAESMTYQPAGQWTAERVRGPLRLEVMG